MPTQSSICQTGRRVRVIQQVPQRETGWSSTVEGVITNCFQTKTGSKFAHAKDQMLWLDRLELRLDDGELVRLSLDQHTVIEDLGESNSQEK